VLARFKDEDIDTLCRHCELESIRVSIENLRTFPFIAEALAENRLNIHGVYFDIESGSLMELDQNVGEFRAIDLPDRSVRP
jgi:carbonic anhydrase